jgi:hypothetical protein
MLPTTFTGQVTTLASHFFDVPYQDILSKRRDRTIVRARHAAMSCIREVKGYSFPRIGRAYDRDHTTVMHACWQTQDLLATDRDFAQRYGHLVREADQLNQKIINDMRKKETVVRERLKPRLTTIEVCDIAGYGPQTLNKRIKEGRMPAPVDKAKTLIFDRDAVLMALGLMEVEASTW